MQNRRVSINIVWKYRIRGGAVASLVGVVVVVWFVGVVCRFVVCGVWCGQVLGFGSNDGL